MNKRQTSPKINWTKYSNELKGRGRVDLYIDESDLGTWYARKDSSKQGAPFVFSDACIKVCNIVRFVHNLSLRGAEGFLCSFA